MEPRKPKPSRRFDIHNVGKPGIQGQISNRTKLKSARTVFLTCPICEIEFEREVYAAKIAAVSYCGRACYAASKLRQIEIGCRVCGVPFTIKKSMVGHITCCSPVCKGKCMTAVRLSEMRDGRRQVAPYGCRQV